MKSRRIGKFYIDYHNIMTDDNDSITKALIKLKFVPLRVEFLAYRNEFEYIGLSPQFNETPIGLEPPVYIITVNDLDKNNFSVGVELNVALL